MLKTISNFFREKDISSGTRVLAAATATRWIGWGFAESLIPIFIFSFAGSYAAAGLIRSSYELALIIALPIIGLLADRIRATTLILIGLSLYVIVGTGYLLAGLTGLAIFIVIARFFNGIGYGLDAVGRETYFRRHNSSGKLATVFGYFDSVANFWWIVAAVAGIFLVKYIAIHWLLFLIVPTVLVAFYIVWRGARPKDVAPVVGHSEKVDLRLLLKEFSTWNWQLKMLLGFNFFLAFTSSIVAFFLPIEMYMEGSGYTPIILLGVIMTIPVLFGLYLGKIFDKRGPRIFVYGLLLYGILLFALGLTHVYLWQMVIAFLMGIIQESISTGKEELTTFYSNPEHFGRVSGFMRSIANVGAMAGPLAAGILIDISGTRAVYFTLAVLVGIIALTFATKIVLLRMTKEKAS